MLKQEPELRPNQYHWTHSADLIQPGVLSTHATHRPDTCFVRAPAMCQTLCWILWRDVHCLWSVNPHPCDSLFPVVSIAEPLVPSENMGCVCLSHCCSPGMQHAAGLGSCLWIQWRLWGYSVRSQGIEDEEATKNRFPEVATHTNILFPKIVRKRRNFEQRA